MLSILWGWKVDNILPDKFDLIGGGIALIGVIIIMYAMNTKIIKIGGDYL